MTNFTKSIEFKPLFVELYLNVLFYLIYFPIDFLFSIVQIYVITPYASLKLGLIVAWTGDIEPEREITGFIDANEVPFFKLFENLGEALPQCIIALTFLCNNYPFLNEFETGIFPIPTTAVSLIFSLGSVVMGLYTGISSCKEISDDDDD